MFITAMLVLKFECVNYIGYDANKLRKVCLKAQFDKTFFSVKLKAHN